MNKIIENLQRNFNEIIDQALTYHNTFSSRIYDIFATQIHKSTIQHQRATMFEILLIFFLFFRAKVFLLDKSWKSRVFFIFDFHSILWTSYHRLWFFHEEYKKRRKKLYVEKYLFFMPFENCMNSLQLM